MVHPSTGSSPNNSNNINSNIRPTEMSVWNSTPLPVSTTLRVSPSGSHSSSSINTLGGGARDGIAFVKTTTSVTTATTVNPAPSLPRNFSAASDATATSKVSNSSLHGSHPGLTSTQALVHDDEVEVRPPKPAVVVVPEKEEFVFAQPTSLPPRDK